ncbi:MAG: cadherin domain-containing protein, partial [Phycisphaerae bacterium]|nr:cadherin domain-containing protein [Phycisphaerae bacterium]
VRGHDADEAVGEVLRYELVGGESIFTIDPDSGELRLANPDLLDRSGGTEYVVTVRTTDLSGATYEQSFRLEVTPVVPATEEPSKPDAPEEEPQKQSEHEPVGDAIAADLTRPAAFVSPGSAEDHAPAHATPMVPQISPIVDTPRGIEIDLIPEPPVPVEVGGAAAERETFVGVESALEEGKDFDELFEEVVNTTNEQVQAIQRSAEEAIGAHVKSEAEEPVATSIWALLWGVVRGIQGTEREPDSRTAAEQDSRHRSR